MANFQTNLYRIQQQQSQEIDPNSIQKKEINWNLDLSVNPNSRPQQDLSNSIRMKFIEDIQHPNSSGSMMGQILKRNITVRSLNLYNKTSKMCQKQNKTENLQGLAIPKAIKQLEWKHLLLEMTKLMMQKTKHKKELSQQQSSFFLTVAPNICKFINQFKNDMLENKKENSSKTRLSEEQVEFIKRNYMMKTSAILSQLKENNSKRRNINRLKKKYKDQSKIARKTKEIQEIEGNISSSGSRKSEAIRKRNTVRKEKKISKDQIN